jgi:hypothetical protein
MKKLILVANDAPQTGNTSFVRVLEQHYERKGIETRTLYTDADASPDEIAFWDLEEDPSPQRIMKWVDENDVTILDISSGSSTIISDLFADNELYDELLEFDAELCIAATANDTESAIAGCVALGEGFSDNANYLLLRNSYCNEAENMGAWAGSYGEKVMRYLGALEIKVPEFDPGMAAELDAQGMDLAAGLSARKELPRYLRDALHAWEISYSGSLDEADEVLLPEVDSSRSAYA